MELPELERLGGMGFHNFSLLASGSFAGPDASGSFAHALDKTGDVYDGAAYGTAPDVPIAVVSANAHDVEAAVKRFQCGLCINSRSNLARRAVFDIDRDHHCDFT